MNLILVSLALCAALGATAYAQKAGDKKKPAAAAPAPAPKPAVQDVSPDAAEKLIAERKDVIVVDVRTAAEYDLAHIAGAKNIPVTDPDFDEKLKEIEGKPVLVHCASGVRSLRAVTRMSATGKFPEIYHLSSGIAGWEDARKPVVASPKQRK